MMGWTREASLHVICWIFSPLFNRLIDVVRMFLIELRVLEVITKFN